MSKIIDIRTVQAVPFKTMIEALKEILVDINIEFSDEGLKIMEIDATQSVLVHLKLEANQFQVYKCNKRIIIGISVINLFKLIKTITNNEICRDMGNLSDIVEVQVINNSLVFKCEGDYAKQETIFKETEKKTDTKSNIHDNIIFKENENKVDIIQGYYSLKHLISFTKCTNLCQSLEIYINNNYPLIIVYDIGNMGKLTLCLSPKQLHNS